MRTFVSTCDSFYWCLKPFVYLHNLYWSEQQPVVVGGYGSLGFDLSPNFKFYSIDVEMYSKERWSDGIIRFLSAMPDLFFIWMQEDYWLIRTVDVSAVASLEGYMALHPEVYRIDLTSDRLYAGCIKTELGSWGHLDLFSMANDCPYQNSIQACVYNRIHLLRMLKPSMSPAQFELEAVIPEELKVLGTRQVPVRYTIGWGTGHEGVNLEGIPQEHVEEMRKRGYFDGRT